MTRSGPRPRLGRAEACALVRDAGVALLLEDGLAASGAPIGYADAFRWLAEHRSLTVSRAQVHRRIWDSVDRYRRDVLAALTSFPTESTYAPTLAAVTEELEALGPVDGARLPVGERRRILIRLARAAVEANAAAARLDRKTTAFDALWAMHSFGAPSDRGCDDPVRSAVFAGQQQSVDRFISLYDEMGAMFDARASTHWGLPHAAGLRLYAELLYCVNHGAGSRSVHQFEHRNLTVGGERWTVEGLTAAAVTGCMATMDEPHTRRPVEDCVVAPRVVTHGNNAQHPGKEEPVDSPPTGHRIERSALRRHMLDAGVALILDGGFGHGGEHVTYSRVFARLERQTGVSLARAQVHERVWPSQQAFQHEVLAASVAGAPVHAGSSQLDRAIDQMAGDAGEGRAAEIIRHAAAEGMTAAAGDPSWLVSQAIASFHALNPRRSSEVEAALHTAYRRDIRAWSASFAAFCQAAALTARPWTGCSTERACVVLAHCADALAEGVAGRMRMDGSPPTYRLSVAGGPPAPWDLFGIGLWSLIEFLFEPRHPPKQPSIEDQNST